MNFTRFCERVLGVSFSPAQSVLYRVLHDGVDPGQLEGADRELARQLFGGVDVIPPQARRVVVLVKGARIGGSRFSATRLVHLALTADLHLAPGEQAFGLIVAPDVRLARQSLAFGLGAARANPDIARRVRAVTADSFELVRDDGAVVTIAALPATSGGSAVRGRTLVGAVMSEASFFRDSSAAVNDADIYRALLPRVVRGGQLILESTPWAQSGLVWEFFDRQHGRPSSALVAQAPTLLMRGNDPDVVALVEGERARDAASAAREFDAEFLSIGSELFFDSNSIDEAIDHDMPHPFRPEDVTRYGRAAAGDVGLKRDGSGFAIILNRPDGARVAFLDELIPQKGMPLTLGNVLMRWVSAMKAYSMKDIFLDQHEFGGATEALATAGIKTWLGPSGPSGKLETFLCVKEMLNEGKLRLPKHDRLILQMKSAVAKPQAGGGLRIEVPRRAGRGHGDLLSSVILAARAIWVSNQRDGLRLRHEEAARRIMSQMPMTREERIERAGITLLEAPDAWRAPPPDRLSLPKW